MAVQRYGFIFKAPGMQFLTHNGQLESDAFAATVCGVASIEEAVLVAQELLTRHVQLIELCGAFSEADVEQIRSAIDDRVPVAAVQYSAETRQRLQQLSD
ncbi:hypothetical protein H8F21_11380 [Pseudomonas sp. P66]|uniref:Uncharacterized protein n=1 Tax=Pseudomonas arcuscaelestis TaxID=2710591 RepID=A0ABS2BX09_9PSED|nr:DUF6506 family protein [Pseudomonas arcuscaelestis]MBM3108873.1 hypothetical protein [Pseudomonas arcuscaelestis]MBM3113973.1 hypothetical protein [Pseudomonas arcuscaelestis]MBM5458160.1 hypothetical protein [Pseudomonas arcuscaelestis]